MIKLPNLLECTDFFIKRSDFSTFSTKGKAVPLKAWSDQKGSRKLRFLDYMTTAQDGGKVVSPYAPAAFTPRKYSWYSFLLEAESNPGP